MLPLWLRQWRYRRKAVAPALATCWNERPTAARSWRQTAFLVCDGEMSSLDASAGELLSLGWIPLRDGCIVAGEARHLLLRARGGVGASAVIHQLRDTDVARGVAPADALAEFLGAARGHVLVFHNARLDLAYLNRLALAHCGAPLLLPCVDTLRLEARRLRRREQAIEAATLTLAACRERYGLPPYAGHNALVDALATAELLLAHAGAGGDCSLRDLLRA